MVLSHTTIYLIAINMQRNLENHRYPFFLHLFLENIKKPLLDKLVYLAINYKLSNKNNL